MSNLLKSDVVSPEMVGQLMQIVPEILIRVAVNTCAKTTVAKFCAARDVARERDDFSIMIKPKGTYFVPDSGYMSPSVAKYCLRKDYCDPTHPTMQRSIARDVDLFDYFTDKDHPIVLEVFLDELTLVDNLEIFSQISINASVKEILGYVFKNDAVRIYREISPEITDTIRAMCVFGCAKARRSFAESRCYAEIFGPSEITQQTIAVVAIEEIIRLGYPLAVIIEALQYVRPKLFVSAYVKMTKCKLTRPEVIEFLPLFPVGDILGIDLNLLLKNSQKRLEFMLKHVPNVVKFEISPDGDHSLLLKAAACDAADWFKLHFLMNPLIPTKVLTTAIQHNSENCVDVIFDEIQFRGLELQLGRALITANSKKYTLLAIHRGIYYISEKDYAKALESGAKRFLRGCREGGINVSLTDDSD